MKEIINSLFLLFAGESDENEEEEDFSAKVFIVVFIFFTIIIFGYIEMNA